MERMYYNEHKMHRASPRPLADLILEAEVKCSRALADGNAAREAGNASKAERLYERSQRWLDKYNTLKERLL